MSARTTAAARRDFQDAVRTECTELNGAPSSAARFRYAASPPRRRCRIPRSRSTCDRLPFARRRRISASPSATSPRRSTRTVSRGHTPRQNLTRLRIERSRCSSSEPDPAARLAGTLVRDPTQAIRSLFRTTPLGLDGSRGRILGGSIRRTRLTTAVLYRAHLASRSTPVFRSPPRLSHRPRAPLRAPAARPGESRSNATAPAPSVGSPPAAPRRRNLLALEEEAVPRAIAVGRTARAPSPRRGHSLLDQAEARRPIASASGEWSGSSPITSWIDHRFLADLLRRSTSTRTAPPAPPTTQMQTAPSSPGDADPDPIRA